MNSRRRNLINWKLVGGEGLLMVKGGPRKVFAFWTILGRCARAPQSKTMSNFSSRKIFNLIASPVAKSWEVSSKANVVAPCRRNREECGGWKSSMSEFTNKVHKVFAYAVHFEDDLSVLSVKISNYDTRQISSTLDDGTLGCRDKAVQARREVHLPDDIAVDIDELFARESVASPLQQKIALSSVCLCDYAKPSGSGMVLGLVNNSSRISSLSW